MKTYTVNVIRPYFEKCVVAAKNKDEAIQKAIDGAYDDILDADPDPKGDAIFDDRCEVNELSDD